MTAVLAAFAAWLLVGIVLSARSGNRETGPSGWGHFAGAIFGACIALPPKATWALLAVGAVVSWAAQ